MPKIWRLLPHDADAIRRLSRALNVSPILAQLLLNRNVDDPQAAQRFLAAPLKELREPESLPGISEATGRILAAARAGRRICIYGDYDVDGVTGTAILLTCLRRLGIEADFHVPHRLQEGYGLNRQAIAQLAARGIGLIVTVDCGISSFEEVEHARSLGLEVIITDHHEPRGALPHADVIVHPRLGGADIPVCVNGQGTAADAHQGGPERPPSGFAYLSGAGVAFKLAWALCKRHCNSARVTPPLREFLLDAVTLAALGTVADVVPLFEENRIFVRHGLLRLGKQPPLGLRALLRSAKLEGRLCLDAVDIGYTLAPRINAAGRLGTANLAVELLTTGSADRAQTLAEHLESQNQQRQVLERRILGEAKTLADQEAGAPAFILASSAWHPGLLGIVASRLVDQFARPVLMIAAPEGQAHAQGSGRSVPGFKLHQALEECTGDLLSHGGHAAAAGFRILPELIGSFRARFCAVVARQLGPEPQPPSITLDAEVPLAALTPGLLQGIQHLEPYGAGNPPPVLLTGPVRVVGEPRKVGIGERHLALRIEQQGRTMRAIAFGMAERAQELMSAAGICSIAFTPRFSEHAGQRWMEIEVRDFQAGEQARLEKP